MENKEIDPTIFIRRAEESVRAVQKISESNFNALIVQGQSAMKSVLLINAGAVVAVLAFYSEHVDLMLSTDSRIPELYKMLLDALLYWAVGVGISTMAYGATYLSQYCMEKNFNQRLSDFKDAVWFNKNASIGPSKWGMGWQYVAIGLVIAGYACFFAGIYVAYSALNVFFK